MATLEFVKTNEKIAEALMEVFFNVKYSVVDRCIKVEDIFIETYPTKEDETIAKTKERLLQGRAQREQAQWEGWQTVYLMTLSGLYCKMFTGHVLTKILPDSYPDFIKT